MPPHGPTDIGAKQICDALSSFGISADQDKVVKIRDYTLLLLKWNRTISLTTVTNPAEIVGRHFGESVFASKLIDMVQCRLVDIGTGAGFPGLALKIFCPGLRLTLIESNKKKCAFLSEVVRTLGLSDVEICNDRFEEIRPENVQANFITSRAVGDFKQILKWSKIALVHRGHVIFWVGSEDSTRIASTPNWIWQPAVRIPDSQRRFVLIGRPNDDTPTKK